MPDAVATLAGEPPGWPATLRDLLRTASDGTLDRTSVLEGLAGDEPADDGAAERRLAFLEAAGVFTCEDGACEPGESGREYLDTHDESVLFAAVAGAADGVEPAVEALAVRPLTDVEVADLLSAELDADVDRATAGRYLAWLRALGYLDRDDGVNELTRRGRRLVATTDGLTPPGVDTARGAPDRHNGDADLAPDARTPPEDAVTPLAANSPAGADADPASTVDPGASSSDDAAADLERDLRARYDDTCMLCGERRQSDPEAGYAEVHYLMPLEDPHDGPTAAENALVVCPNHRADLDHGTISIDPQSLTADHAYEAEVSGRTLLTVEDHDVGAQYLAYHNDVIAGE